MNLSSDSHMSYVLDSTGAFYTLKVWNTQGKNHTDLASSYSYVSNAGGVVGP